MSLDPRTPVLIGVGVVQQREEDPARAAEPLELMASALERAAEDAGSRTLLERADSIRVPRGFWDYADPCRWLAERFGATRARTELAEIGVLQTTLLGRAARDIADGRSEVCLITGAEARYRMRSARRTGIEAPLTALPDRPADSVLRPEGDIISRLEIAKGIHMPVGQYAMIENALRFAEGQDLADHRRAVAELWSRMSDVAADNPDAWSPRSIDAATIRDAGPRNRMLAFPYTKLHNSNWTVDQSAGLVLCSVEAARAAGVPRDRWVFPLAVAEANHMVPLSERRELHRAPGFACAGERVLQRSGRSIDEVVRRELYSCFPVAVRVQARELGIDEAGEVTVTGGMAFAGGPLNNFVLQALARMAHVLRRQPGATGMLNAISGVITKQGVSLWSTDPAEGGFHYDDVSNETTRATRRVEVIAEADGPATIATYTVLHSGEDRQVVLLCDLPDGRRSLATSADPKLAETGEQEELCGRRITLEGGIAH